MSGKKRTFRRELAALINKYSREGESNTPDFILAEYLINCLKAYESAANSRDAWYGRIQRPGRQEYPVGIETPRLVSIAEVRDEIGRSPGEEPV